MQSIKQQRQATANGIARAAKYAFPDDPIACLHYAADSGPIGKALVRSFLSALNDEQRERLIAMEARWLKRKATHEYVWRTRGRKPRTQPDGIGDLAADGTVASARRTPAGAARRDRELRNRVAALAARSDVELRKAVADLERDTAFDKIPSVIADNSPAPRIGPDGRVVHDYAPSTDENDPVRFPVVVVASGHIGAS